MTRRRASGSDLSEKEAIQRAPPLRGTGAGVFDGYGEPSQRFSAQGDLNPIVAHKSHRDIVLPARLSLGAGAVGLLHGENNCSQGLAVKRDLDGVIANQVDRNRQEFHLLAEMQGRENLHPVHHDARAGDPLAPVMVPVDDLQDKPSRRLTRKRQTLLEVIRRPGRALEDPVVGKSALIRYRGRPRTYRLPWAR